jgi:hypothetical protein
MRQSKLQAGRVGNMTLREIYRLGIEETERLRRGKPLETEELRHRAGLPPASTGIYSACQEVATLLSDQLYVDIKPENTPTLALELLPKKTPGVSEAVTKIKRSNHKRGRPLVVIPNQLSLADQPGLSLRKRAEILGVSRMTVLRRDRERSTAKEELL